MLTFLLMLSWLLSMIFMFLNHPLSFGFILLLQTIIISLSTGILNINFWFSYILFLIMIGGLLVLFIYMTSIASNEKFKFSKKISFLSITSLLMMFFYYLNMNFNPILNMNNYDFIKQTIYNINFSLNKLVNWPSLMLMIMLMIYLLITLIAIVKITKSKMGPLRAKS